MGVVHRRGNDWELVGLVVIILGQGIGWLTWELAGFHGSWLALRV